MVIVSITAIGCALLINQFNLEDNIIGLLIRLGTSILIPSIIICIFYFKTEEFKYFLQLALNVLKRGKKDGKEQKS
jgi:hypothetical protein